MAVQLNSNAPEFRLVPETEEMKPFLCCEFSNGKLVKQCGKELCPIALDNFKDFLPLTKTHIYAGKSCDEECRTKFCHVLCSICENTAQSKLCDCCIECENPKRKCECCESCLNFKCICCNECGRPNCGCKIHLAKCEQCGEQEFCVCDPSNFRGIAHTEPFVGITHSKPCKFFASPQGCKFGSKCRNPHVASSPPMASYPPVIPLPSASSSAHSSGKPQQQPLCFYHFTQASGCTKRNCPNSHAYRAPEGMCRYGSNCRKGQHCPFFCPPNHSF
uniref:C3H1-type domain-containing protein n=1 Tax=viral metagenome TaxID=1070528 RepID=A0A6C0DYU2_9ZZZZ